MNTQQLPSRPERWLRAVVGDTPKAITIIGDLREEYGAQPPGPRRTMAYAAACGAIALRYAPSALFDALRVEGRHAARGLLRAPTYTLATVATLALGIGIAATLLTLTYGSLLRPLPYPDADRLIGWGQSPLSGPGAGSINSLAAANLRDLSGGLRQFTGLAGFTYRRVTLTSSTGAQRVLVSSVTGSFFDVLGARPLLGRTFAPADDVDGAPPTVILNERLWQREFAGAPGIVGATVTLDGVAHRVIGVMPGHLPWPGDPQMWSPMRWTASEAAVRARRAIEGVARLSPGATLASATDELKSRFAALAAMYPSENGQATVATRPLKDIIVGSLGPNSSLLPLLAGLAGVMLCVAYLNVATLSIGRREARQHEIALRRVLGASGWRQRCARWMDGSMVALAGGAGGALLAAWTIPLVLSRYGASIARAETIAVDGSTAIVIVLMAAGGAALIAMTSGTRAGAPGLALSRRTTTGAGRVRRALVAAQVGLAGGLLYGALLLGWMIASLGRVDLGVPLEHAITFAVGVPGTRYETPAQIGQFFDGLESSVRALSGVTAVGGTSRTPFAGGTNGGVSNADEPSRTVPIAEWRAVTPGFFQALGVSTVDGRLFSRDAGAEARTVVVSQALSEALFGTAEGSGRRVTLGNGPPHTVAGVVSDILDFGPTRPGRPTVYVLHASAPGFASTTEMTMIIRTAGPPMPLVGPLRDAVAGIDRDVPIRAVATLEELASRSLGANRTTAGTVLITLAGLALALGMIGVFGVTAVSVERRTREIGVRLALGDTPSGILRLILVDGLKLAATGVVLGAGTSWLVYHLIEAFIVSGFQPGHAPVAALSLGLLLCASLVACVVPARRAAGLSPTEALRAE